jgi:hypothetical protein
MKKIKSYKTFEEKSVNLEKNELDLTQKIVEMTSFDKKLIQSIVDKLLVALQTVVGSSTPEKNELTDKASEYLNKYWSNLHDNQTKKFVEENRAVILDQAVKQLLPDDED